MAGKVLVTGSSGLIGRHLVPLLRGSFSIVLYDIRPLSDDPARDICDDVALRQAMEGVEGVVHLAAVSRVVWGEINPAQCRCVNEEGTRKIAKLAADAHKKPWILYASSREVYGNAEVLPVQEAADLRPINVYARSKVVGEEAIAGASRTGVPTAIVRLSSVYGDDADHSDRVVPAFCRAALAGEPLRVEGSANLLDLTAAADVAGALTIIASRLHKDRESLPTVHLVSGKATSLRELAQSIIRMTGGRSEWRETSPRTYDVSRFVGDPARAERLFGWRATTPLETGLAALIKALGS